MTERRRWLDEQYSPSRSARDPHGATARWRAGTADARAQHSGEQHRVIRYGSRPRNEIELFLPRVATPVPTLLFLHGGWWQEGSIDVAGFPAKAFTDAGFGWGSIGYTLAPEATLHDIVSEVDLALAALVGAADDRIDPSRMILSGHSAGAHLAAAHAVRLGDGLARTQVSGLLLVSGAYDLPPVQESYVNDLVRMSFEEAVALSPLRHGRPRGLPVVIGVGSDETDEFIRNARELWEAWSVGSASTELIEVEKRDHFDILDELTVPEGVLAQNAFTLLRAGRS